MESNFACGRIPGRLSLAHTHVACGQKRLELGHVGTYDEAWTAALNSVSWPYRVCAPDLPRVKARALREVLLDCRSRRLDARSLRWPDRNDGRIGTMVGSE